MMDLTITAKPIQWEEAGNGEWLDREYGFSISYDPDSLPELPPYVACWGESDEDFFSTLEEAQAWCQDTINAYVRRVAVVTPNVAGNRLDTVPRGKSG
ncbi:MAG: hypothetical protein ACKO0Z_03560 [Betaproteobacteria bacterium]